MRFTARWTAAMLLGALSAGCGDDPGSDGTGKQTVGALSTAQVESVCKSVQSKIERMGKALVSVTCTDAALLDADTCVAERKACIADPPADVTVDADADFDCGAASQESITNDCPELTVDQLQGCLEAVVKTFETTAASFTCSSDPNTLAEPATPKACRDLEPVCPMLSDFGR